MLELQSSMNAKVNPNWLTAGYPFLRATVVEGCEAMEHHGWKWWKAHSLDLPQLQMELVDIWHFALSDFIIKSNGDFDNALSAVLLHGESNESILFDGKEYDVSKLDTVAKLELMIGLATSRRFSVVLFAELLRDCKMDWDDLYRQYVSKNVLNFFRQDNGYKAGTYRKMWSGREDNDHLVEIIGTLDATDEEFRHKLYNSLRDRYAQSEVVANPA